MTVWAVLVAAGGGTRFGRSKHDVLLGGEPVWVRAREGLLAGGVDRVVVVGPVPGGVPGGSSRRESVAAGLERMPTDVDIVLVHDAARPLLSPTLTRRVVDRLLDGDCDGVVPVVPVRDTLKVVAGDRVVRTVDRSRLVAAQTPQGFVPDALRAAHASIGDPATDDAALVEALGGVVATVAGDPLNLKLTYPEDLALAEAVLRIRAAAE